MSTAPRGPGPDVDDGRLARVLESFAWDIDGLDENDPKQAAALMLGGGPAGHSHS